MSGKPAYISYPNVSLSGGKHKSASPDHAKNYDKEQCVLIAKITYETKYVFTLTADFLSFISNKILLTQILACKLGYSDVSQRGLLIASQGTNLKEAQ